MKIIVAVDKNWGIGKRNDLLFKLPLDMARFRKITTGSAVVMGSNTLISFPNSKPLPKRTNIVLCPEYEISTSGVTQAHCLDELFQLIKAQQGEVFVIGGARMYHTMLPYCDTAYITKVDADGDAEVFFDNLDTMPNWSVADTSEVVIDNELATRYITYVNSDVKKF